MIKHVKNLVVGIVLLLAALLVVVNLFGAWALTGVLEKAVGAPVKVGRLSVNVFTSSLGLYGFKIENPPGFHEKTLAEIREISVKYDLPAIFTGKIHLNRVRLDFGDITLEKSGGKVNLMELGAVKGITKGISGGESKPQQPETPETPQKAPAPQEKKGPQKTMPLAIDETLVNIGKVRYVDSGAQPPLLKEYDLGVHNENFKDITNASSLVKDIAFLVLRKVGLSSLTGNFDILAKEVGGQIETTFNQMKNQLFKG